MNDCGLILFAAGASTRMKQPKQLLPYRGKSLLRHSIEVATQSLAQPVVVVLGANEQLIKNDIGNSEVYIVYNHEWQKGMGASIRTGLTELNHIAPGIRNVIFMACDQPFISSGIINELIKINTSLHKGIVACSYGNSIGVPALFSKSYFHELLQLNGQEGAKSIIARHPDATAIIPFPQGEIDIDTMHDYNALMTNS